MSNDEPKLDYRDPEWVAEQLGIDKNTVYKYLQDGSLPGLQLGRKWLVSERRLADFLERVEREQTSRRRACLFRRSSPLSPCRSASDCRTTAIGDPRRRGRSKRRTADVRR